MTSDSSNDAAICEDCPESEKIVIEMDSFSRDTVLLRDAIGRAVILFGRIPVSGQAVYAEQYTCQSEGISSMKNREVRRYVISTSYKMIPELHEAFEILSEILTDGNQNVWSKN